MPIAAESPVRGARSRRVWAVVCVVSAIFTVLALVPGTIVVGTLFLVLPGVVLVAAPYLFAVSLAGLIAAALFGHLGFAPRMGVYAGLALLMVALAVAAAWLINRPLMTDWEKLSAADHPWSVNREDAEAIALLQDRAAAGGNPWLCLTLCQRLLYSGTVQSVLQGPSPADGESPIADASQPLVRYRVEQRDSCSPVTLPDGLIRQNEENIFNKRQLLDEVRIRIAAGRCLVAETATLSQSDLAVVNEVLRNAHQPYMKERWKLDLDTLSARRLTVYRIRDGRPVQLSRQTSMTAYPVFTPLLIGVRTGDPIDIELGILRVVKKHPGGDINAFFETAFGLKAIPGGSRPTVSGVGGEFAGNFITKEPLRPPDPSTGEAERLLREALADPTLPPNSPKLVLAGLYFERVARERRGDVPLMAGVISDRRVTDVSDALRRAVISLGFASAPLAGPLLNRIEAEIPGGPPKFIRQLSESFDALPPGAANRVMPQLESLAHDKQRRERAYRILPRLADKGTVSIPSLLELMDAGPQDPLVRAGISGLCRLGPPAASAAPALFSRLEAYRNADKLGDVESAEVEALIRIGKKQELEHFFTQPRAQKFVINRLRMPALVGCRALP